MDCRCRESPRSDVLEGNIINQSKVSFGVLQGRSNSDAERWNLGQRLFDMFDICKRDFQRETSISFVYFNLWHNVFEKWKKKPILFGFSFYRLFHTRVTAIAHKWSRPFCLMFRWQVTAKHACTLRAWSDMVHGCMAVSYTHLRAHETA